jgi:hypothetical protein
VVGEDKKMGGFAGEGLYPENSFLEKGFGGDQFEKVFGFCLAAEGPETFATATSHNKEKERGHGHEIKVKMKTKGVGNFL